MGQGTVSGLERVSGTERHRVFHLANGPVGVLYTFSLLACYTNRQLKYS